MTRKVLKADVGKHGKLIAGAPGYKKTVYGTILYVDYFGAVVFLDHEDISHRFVANLIDEFTEEEFKDKSK